MPFRDLGVDEVICTALEDAGIHTTFPIQALTLPLAIDGQDIIGQARTGTGKTLAFGVPMLHRLATTLAADRAAKAARAPSSWCPRRELAIQVAEDLKQAGAAARRARAHRLRRARLRAADRGAARRASTSWSAPRAGCSTSPTARTSTSSKVRALVLDEADKMLDLGFLPDVERLLRLTPDDRQTMLFSATMPGEVVTLARRHMRRPTNIRAEEPDESAPPPLTSAARLPDAPAWTRSRCSRGCCRPRTAACRWCSARPSAPATRCPPRWTDRGFAAATVHGDLGQAQRERALRAFRSGKVDVLVATDVAARGIDVDDVTHVINYECPDDEKAYVHRIGRTGRAGRAGVAVTFVDWRDMQRWKLINDALGLGQPEPAETYSTSEHLYTDLSIPPDVTGTLPRASCAAQGRAWPRRRTEDLGETGRIRSRRQPAARPEPGQGRARDTPVRRRHRRRDDKADPADRVATPRQARGAAAAPAAAARSPGTPPVRSSSRYTAESGQQAS